MENLSEKQEMQKRIDEIACNNLVDFFKEKSNEVLKPIPLMIIVLEQIKAASTSLSADETEERILLNTQKYLQFKIDELKCFNMGLKAGNTFNDCIRYLGDIASGALKWQDEELGKQISERLEYFVNELKERYNETE